MGARTEKQVEKQFKKGRSGNPKGRPKGGTALTDVLKKMLDEIDPEDAKKRTHRELITMATIKLAKSGNSTALNIVWDRSDGKLKQDVGLGFDQNGGGKIIVEFVKPEDSDTGGV